jgi:hypothetical protein
MPFETVKSRTAVPAERRRKRRADSDETSDYDDREEPSSDEAEKPEPVVEPVQKKAPAPAPKKASNKAAPPQKQAAQSSKTAAAQPAAKTRTPSANERDLQKQREEIVKK